MTGTPQGRDGTLSVAALAVQVNALRRDIEALATKVATLARTQQAQTTQSDDLRELHNQVDRILALLGDADEERPSAWFWLTMTEEEREHRFGELRDWVESVLRVQYPGYLADHTRTCWPNHPEARWELAWLYQLWCRAYLTKRADPKAAADWHDRWLPGVIRRLTAITCRCQDGCSAD